VQYNARYSVRQNEERSRRRPTSIFSGYGPKSEIVDQKLRGAAFRV
jgi:hypothetical protein